jgi:hypothetical protein
MLPGYHAMFVGLASGTLVLAFVALTYRVWFAPRSGILRIIWNAADAVAVYAALLGFVALVLSTVTGLGLRPMEAFLNSPITKNKILLAALATVCWGAFLAIRIRAGPRLWELGRFTAHYTYVMALAGFFFLISTNSIGGDIAGIPSGYEQIAEAFGYRTREAFYFPTTLNVLLWLAGIAALVAGIRAGRRRLARAAESEAP